MNSFVIKYFLAVLILISTAVYAEVPESIEAFRVSDRGIILARDADVDYTPVLTFKVPESIKQKFDGSLSAVLGSAVQEARETSRTNSITLALKDQKLFLYSNGSLIGSPEGYEVNFFLSELDGMIIQKRIQKAKAGAFTLVGLIAGIASVYFDPHHSASTALLIGIPAIWTAGGILVDTIRVGLALPRLGMLGEWAKEIQMGSHFALGFDRERFEIDYQNLVSVVESIANKTAKAQTTCKDLL